jgi:glutathione synthase/RimK-type ligase-like ATP-grasp enzyme
LAGALGGKVLKLEGSTFQPKIDDVIINWGASSCPIENALNPFTVTASNKLDAFRALHSAGVSIPRFASSSSDVDWTGTTVCRHKLTGHSGEGIELVEEGQELPSAPLYVQYIKKKDEYRIHASADRIIAVQRKARRLDTPDSEVNWQVRNHANGFVFVRDNVDPPESVLSEARGAVTALGLDFGAVDVIFNEHEGKAYVLEVNTAPGLEGQTIEDYATFFRSL